MNSVRVSCLLFAARLATFRAAKIGAGQGHRGAIQRAQGIPAEARAPSAPSSSLELPMAANQIPPAALSTNDTIQEQHQRATVARFPEGRLGDTGSSRRLGNRRSCPSNRLERLVGCAAGPAPNCRGPCFLAIGIGSKRVHAHGRAPPPTGALQHEKTRQTRQPSMSCIAEAPRVG